MKTIFVFLLSGLASFYNLPGASMADGHIFHPRSHVCAMRTRWYGKRVDLLNRENGRTSWCVVEDYGPAAWTGRVIDVSPIVAEELDMVSAGVVKVSIYHRSHIRTCTTMPYPLTCKAPPPQECVLSPQKPTLITCRKTP